MNQAVLLQVLLVMLNLWDLRLIVSQIQYLQYMQPTLLFTKAMTAQKEKV